MWPSAYATKHAVIGLTESVSWELRGSGVEISCVCPVLVNTQLADGIKRTRAARTIEPQDVAAAVVEALRRPKVVVCVPKVMGTITKFSRLLPTWVGDRIMIASGSDHLLADAVNDRAEYEARVAASAPSVINRRAATSDGGSASVDHR